MVESAKSSDCWEYLPSEVLTNIFSFLSLKERSVTSATCTRWRQLFFLPVFWRNVTLVVKNGFPGCDLYCRMAASIKHLEVMWQGRKRNRFDHNTAGKLVTFFRALSDNNFCLRLLIVKFEKEGTFAAVSKSIKKILVNCQQLERLSFGEHWVITFKNVISLTQGTGQLKNLRELHMVEDKTIAQGEAVLTFETLTLLHTLSISWTEVTPQLLESLSRRQGVTMEKLVLYVYAHLCRRRHPSVEQWKKFTLANPKLRITLVITSNSLMCPDVFNIHGNVWMLKILDDFCPVNMIHKFKGTLEALVFVNTRRPLDWEVIFLGSRDIAVCQNTKYLSITGYFIRAEKLLSLAKAFPELERLTATKAHIVAPAEATQYDIPISGANLTRFEAGKRGGGRTPGAKGGFPEPVWCHTGSFYCLPMGGGGLESKKRQRISTHFALCVPCHRLLVDALLSCCMLSQGRLQRIQ